MEIYYLERSGIVQFYEGWGAEGCPHSHLRRSSVLPAGHDMGNDTGMALFAHVNAINFNDALAWVKASDGCYSAYQERKRERNVSIKSYQL